MADAVAELEGRIAQEAVAELRRFEMMIGAVNPVERAKMVKKVCKGTE